MFKGFKLLFQEDSQEGSIIVIALMVLAIMTVIGLMSADTTITENFIVRNAGIHKQNVSLVEAAVMEGLQDVIQIDASDPDNLSPGTNPNDWINSDDTAWTTGDWYAEDSATQLNANNSVIPDLVSNNNTNSMSMLNIRGEEGAGNLRVAVVGWEGAPGASLKATGPTRKAGRVLAEYVSADAGGNSNNYGMLRMEIGVERVF
jgi:hypothetical protein